MQELKQLTIEAFNEFKNDPVEAIGSILCLSSIFGLLYVALWIGCPC